MTAAFRAACVQLNAPDDLGAGIAAGVEGIRRARDGGADFIATPENTPLIEMRKPEQLAKAAPMDSHPAVPAFCALAKELEAWLSIGSITVKLAEDRLANRQLLIDPQGELAATYDKIHMFDVEIPDGQSYRESKLFKPGREAVLAALPWGKLGMTICYDLRFPQLYRDLAQAGAEILVVPAAFTRFTGKAHWHVLLRARAIETGCYVLAAAQCGTHSRDRETYGHSLIVAPWGEVLADSGEEVGTVSAEIDLAKVAEARRMIPAWSQTPSYEIRNPESLRAAGE
ncbi:MAG: carbon-nitrogen hydrolase family protein [Rhodovibrionaceae bacterium]